MHTFTKKIEDKTNDDDDDDDDDNNNDNNNNNNNSKQRKWSSQENKIVMECYLFSEPKVRGYRKRMLSLWLNKGMLWV